MFKGLGAIRDQIESQKCYISASWRTRMIACYVSCVKSFLVKEYNGPFSERAVTELRGNQRLSLCAPRGEKC